VIPALRQSVPLEAMAIAVGAPLLAMGLAG
jgi:hypothetical protein